MRQAIWLALVGLCIAGPAHAESPDKPVKPLKLKKLLPAPIHKKVTLGSPLAEVLAYHPTLQKQSVKHTFRQVWALENYEGNLRSVIFYFDEDLPGNPLYEVMYNFEDPATAPALGADLLGPPNHNVDEWRRELRGANWELASWVHNGKLILAVPMAGTEWENGID